jgi:hypothetical protein
MLNARANTPAMARFGGSRQGEIMNVAHELELKVWPVLDRAAAEIKRSSRWITVNAVSELEGRDRCYLKVECRFWFARKNQPTEIALEIEVEDLRTEPYWAVARVAWGEPSYHEEAELFPDAALVTFESIARFEAELPTLVDALKTAVKRRHPPKDSG